MRTEDIEYTADGRRLVGYLAVDDDRGDEGRPGVLVAHEGPGLSDHAKGRARRLAELGYVAFALDYMGDGRPQPGDVMTARITELRADPGRTRSVAQAGLDILRAQPATDPTRVAAIGFCMGGTVALELARGGADLRAVVGFHSGLATLHPDDSRITAKVLVCIGSEDPFISPGERAAFEQEMRAGQVDWWMELYGGAVHSFTNEDADGTRMPGVKYDAAADRRSWRAMLDLFDDTLGPV